MANLERFMANRKIKARALAREHIDFILALKKTGVPFSETADILNQEHEKRLETKLGATTITIVLNELRKEILKANPGLSKEEVDIKIIEQARLRRAAVQETLASMSQGDAKTKTPVAAPAKAVDTKDVASVTSKLDEIVEQAKAESRKPDDKWSAFDKS